MKNFIDLERGGLRGRRACPNGRGDDWRNRFGGAFVKFLRHAPAPKKSSVWAGCLFDTFQDLASNDSRYRGEARWRQSLRKRRPPRPPPEQPLQPL